MKFKRILISLLIYLVIILLYLSFIELDVNFFYTNIIFIIIYLIVTNLFIEKDNLINFKLHRYKNTTSYFIDCFKRFTINIFIILVCFSILNCLALHIMKINFQISLIIYYFINLFFILEILYIYILSFSLKNNINLMRCLTSILMLAMFTFGKFDIGITPVNIFKYILYSGNWFQIIIHYAIWLISAYIFLDYNSKRIEL